MGVRGFPTLHVNNSLNNTQLIYGFRPYAVFENSISSLAPAAFKESYDKSWEALFAKYPTLTAREFTELSGKSRQESETLLKQLTQEGKLKQHTTKNGSIWRVQ
jgi:predicted HTH transcriptional regulator